MGPHVPDDFMILYDFIHSIHCFFGLLDTLFIGLNLTLVVGRSNLQNQVLEEKIVTWTVNTYR